MQIGGVAVDCLRYVGDPTAAAAEAVGNQQHLNLSASFVAMVPVKFSSGREVSLPFRVANGV